MYFVDCVYFQGRQAVKRSLRRKHSDVKNHLEEMMAGARSSNTAKEMMSRSNRKGKKQSNSDSLLIKVYDPLI